MGEGTWLYLGTWLDGAKHLEGKLFLNVEIEYIRGLRRGLCP